MQVGRTFLGGGVAQTTYEYYQWRTSINGPSTYQKRAIKLSFGMNIEDIDASMILNMDRDQCVNVTQWLEKHDV